MKHVIIGAGIAAISAARSIWSGNHEAEIVLISDEKTKPYYRPLIPLRIKKTDADIEFHDDILNKQNITIINHKATELDVTHKNVVLTDGQKLPFDKLLIASGSVPVLPAISGLSGPGVFTFRTRKDAEEIRSYSTNKKKALIIGGGLIGLKAAIALKEIGLEVTIVEQLPQILLQRLDARGASIISRILMEAGLRIVTSETVTEVVNDSARKKSARLSSGRAIEADMIVAAVGTKPNIAIISKTPIKARKGILINEFLQTSEPDIYAAGDVAEYRDILTGRPAASGLWTNAEEMGRLAGKNMTGAGLKYPGFLTVLNSTEFLNVPVISIGLIEPGEDDYEVITEDDVGSYRKLVFKGDVLMGAIFIGEVKNAGIYTNLIKNKIPIPGLKEEAISGNLGYAHFLISRPPALSA